MDTIFDLGLGWAATGLKHGKTALEQSAKTLEQTAKALETFAAELEKKEHAVEGARGRRITRSTLRLARGQGRDERVARGSHARLVAPVERELRLVRGVHPLRVRADRDVGEARDDASSSGLRSPSSIFV